jgi:hypothetical protein
VIILCKAYVIILCKTYMWLSYVIHIFDYRIWDSFIFEPLAHKFKLFAQNIQYTYVHIHTSIHAYIHIANLPGSLYACNTYIHTYIHACIHTDCQTGRKKDTVTEIQTDKKFEKGCIHIPLSQLVRTWSMFRAFAS